MFFFLHVLLLLQTCVLTLSLKEMLRTHESKTRSLSLWLLLWAGKQTLGPDMWPLMTCALEWGSAQVQPRFSRGQVEVHSTLWLHETTHWGFTLWLQVSGQKKTNCDKMTYEDEVTAPPEWKLSHGFFLSQQFIHSHILKVLTIYRKLFYRSVRLKRLFVTVSQSLS